MEWKLVIVHFYFKHEKQILLTLYCIVLCFLIFLYCYIEIKYRTYDNNVLVTSDKVLGDHEVGNEYYPYFDDFKTEFHGKDIIINMSFSYEEEIDGLFEVVVPFAYRDLLNKRINIMINGTYYNFLVVDVCRDRYKEEYFTVNSDTMAAIYYNSFELDRYTYRFVADTYVSLNESLDVLSSEGYDVLIRPNMTLVRLTNFDQGKDLIVLAFCYFLFLIWVIFI
jgi:hypothetical protein